MNIDELLSKVPEKHKVLVLEVVKLFPLATEFKYIPENTYWKRNAFIQLQFDKVYLGHYFQVSINDDYIINDNKYIHALAAQNTIKIKFLELYEKYPNIYFTNTGIHYVLRNNNIDENGIITLSSSFTKLSSYETIPPTVLDVNLNNYGIDLTINNKLKKASNFIKENLSDDNFLCYKCGIFHPNSMLYLHHMNRKICK